MKKLIILITFFSFATSNIYSQLNNPAISKDTLKTQGRNIIVLQKNIFNQYKKFKSGNKIYKIKELENFLELNTESYKLYQKHINLDKKSKILTSTYCLLTPIITISGTFSTMMLASTDSDDEVRLYGGLIFFSTIFVTGYLTSKGAKLEKESIHTLEKAVLSYNIAIDKNYRTPIENDNQIDLYRKLISLFFIFL